MNQFKGGGYYKLYGSIVIGDLRTQTASVSNKNK